MTHISLYDVAKRPMNEQAFFYALLLLLCVQTRLHKIGTQSTCFFILLSKYSILVRVTTKYSVLYVRTEYLLSPGEVFFLKAIRTPDGGEEPATMTPRRYAR